MNAIVNKIMELSKNLGYLALQYAYVSLYWLLTLAKVQAQKWRRCSAQKKVQKTYSGLGAEIYSAHKLGQDSDWARLPAVQQQLKLVEEVESKVFQVDAVVEQINNDFAAKKAELQAHYAAKRQATETRPAGKTDDRPT
jgi:hypothetical protein